MYKTLYFTEGVFNKYTVNVTEKHSIIWTFPLHAIFAHFPQTESLFTG